MSEIDTGTGHLLCQAHEGVAVLTFNRPERRNALSMEILEALASTLERLDANDEVGCVVLTGAEGAFCAGGDVKAMAESSGSRGRSTVDDLVNLQRRLHRATSGRLWEMSKPTIASIPGPAAGAGLSLALACDLRYAASGAVLTTAFARVGFSGDYGGTWFLSRLVGTAKAKELYFFSDRITAEDAEKLGIVNAIFPPDRLQDEVMDRAHRLASGPIIAYRHMKENINRAVNGPMADSLDIEATHHVHTGLTEDHREAVQAFVEKREPQFKGR